MLEQIPARDLPDAVSADPMRLPHILLNPLNNAVKFKITASACRSACISRRRCKAR
jgi:hypothetical protein